MHRGSTCLSVPVPDGHTHAVAVWHPWPMVDERSPGDDPADDARRTFDNFGDYVRFQAARFTRLAETQHEVRQNLEQALSKMTIRHTDDAGGITAGVFPLLADMDASEQHTRLLGSLSAAQAVAWDHMQAHGGPDDPEAYADYGDATAFHTALMGSTPGATNDPASNIPTGE